MGKLLYLGSSKFSQMMNTERWQLTQGIRKNNNIIFIDVDTLVGERPDLFKIWDTNNRPDAILFEDHEWVWKLKLPKEYSNINKVPVPKWAFIADYWYELNEKKEYFQKNNISGLLALHQSSYPYIKRNFKNITKIASIPFTIDSNEFPSSIQPKEYDVLCSGFMGDLYPLRGRIRDILKKTKTIKSYFLEHPGYWKKGEKIGIRGSEFYALMSKAKYVLTTTGVHNISVRKHLEAIGARSKIIGNVTGYPEHRLISKFVLTIEPNMSDVEIVSKIKESADNWSWKDLDEKRRNYVIKTHDPFYVASMISQKLLRKEI